MKGTTDGQGGALSVGATPKGKGSTGVGGVDLGLFDPNRRRNFTQIVVGIFDPNARRNFYASLKSSSEFVSDRADFEERGRTSCKAQVTIWQAST